jgi:hypothetical protein
MKSKCDSGLLVIPGERISKIKLECQHQKGLFYVVPSDKNWVCSNNYLATHAIAGFMGDLVDLESDQIKALMQKWGIYFRKLPLDVSNIDAI